MDEKQVLWKAIRELHYSISASIEHGEHFYEGGERLQRFLDRLDELKRVSVKYHKALK